MRRIFAWTAVAWLGFAGLQAYGVRRQGLSWNAVLSEAPYWLYLLPPFLITLWTFTDLGLRSSSPKASSRVHGPDADVDASPEALPGASQSLPSVLYLLAVVASFGFGSVTLYLIGEERFLGNLWLLIGGFMLGAAISLFGMFYLIRRWARRRASRSRNP